MLMVLSDEEYIQIGKRVRAARLEKGLTQEELAVLCKVSTNHISHIEIASTKLSLAMFVTLARALEKETDYFIMDTPYALKDRIIDNEISQKLQRLSPVTLQAVNSMLDTLYLQERKLLEGRN